MSELLSRILLSTEAIVICFPLTAFFVSDTLSVQIRHLIDSPTPQAWSNIAMFLPVLATLACLWRLIVVFSVDGGAALRRSSTWWWAFPVASCIAAIGMIVGWRAGLSGEPSWGGELAWSMPFLIPLLHLGLERWMRASAYRAITARIFPLPTRTRRTVKLRSVR